MSHGPDGRRRSRRRTRQIPPAPHSPEVRPVKRSKLRFEQSCWLFKLPDDLWPMVRDLTGAEEAGRFALACRDSLALVQKRAFWESYEQPVFTFSNEQHRRILRFFTRACADAECPIQHLVLEQPYYQDRDGWSDYRGYSLDTVTVEKLSTTGVKNADRHFEDEDRVLGEFGCILNLVATATTDICLSLKDSRHTRTLRSLVISGQKFHDRSLRNLQDLKQLESLSLWDCSEITDQGLTHLLLVPKLKDLNIADCRKITGSGLRNMPITKLTIGAFNRNVLQQLSSLTSLQELDLWDFLSLSPAEVGTLNKGLKKLRLVLDHRASDDLLDEVAGLQGLQALSIPECPDIILQGLAKLQHCSQLEQLRLGSLNQFEDLDVLHACPSLRTLTLLGEENVAPTGLAGCKKLQLLQLQGCEITNATLSDLRGRPLLQEIHVRFCLFTGDVTELKHCPSLRKVTFFRCVLLPEEKLDQLRQDKPGLHVVID